MRDRDMLKAEETLNGVEEQGSRVTFSDSKA